MAALRSQVQQQVRHAGVALQASSRKPDTVLLKRSVTSLQGLENSNSAAHMLCAHASDCCLRFFPGPRRWAPFRIDRIVMIRSKSMVGLASCCRARLQDGIIQALEQQVGQEAAGEDELQERLNFLAFKYALLVDMVRSHPRPVHPDRRVLIVPQKGLMHGLNARLSKAQEGMLHCRNPCAVPAVRHHQRTWKQEPIICIGTLNMVKTWGKAC